MDEPRSGRSEPVDEISLRDLYLIVRRNMAWLLGVPLIVAIGVFGLTKTLPLVYQAQSTTVVTPPPIEIESERGITFKPSVNVTFEAYERLVKSMPVATATLERLQADGEIDGDLVAELTAKQLAGMFELENLTGPSRTGEGSPLTVTHSVRHSDPMLSATIANAWAAESLRTIQASLLDTLSPVDATTEREIASLQAELEAAESALETFDSGRDLALQRLRIERLSGRLTDNELELDAVRRRLDVSEARRQTLGAQLSEELNKVTTSDPVSDAFLAGLSLEDAREFLTGQRDLAAQERASAQVELDAFDEEHNLAVLAARIDNYQGVVATGEIDLVRLSDQASVLRERRALLEQQLAAAVIEAGTSNSLSDRFMTGLTIGDAGDFVASQVERAEESWLSARQALDAFDSEHNLARLGARIDQLNARVTSREARLAELPGEIQVVTERISRLSGQLAEQPSLMTLQDILVASPLLTEAARADGLLLDALAGTELQREEVNQTHVNLLGSLLGARVNEGALRTESSVLVREIAEADQELGALRDSLISLRSERDSLALSYDQADGIYRSARTREQELDYARLDPRGTDRTLRASYDATHLPPELALQDSLREVDREFGNVTSQIAVLQARLTQAEELLPQLRDERISLTTDRERLEESANRAGQAHREIEAKLGDLRRGAIDLRSERSLRDTTPEVLQLQSALREEAVSVWAAQTELATLQSQIEADGPRLATMRQELTGLETQRNRLERSRSNARQAYDDVAQLGPTIAYVTQLAPTTARILSRASVPVDPVGPRALLITALAAIVSGMLMLLFIFLREAVSEPRIPTLRARVATAEEAEGGDFVESNGRLHGATGVAKKEVGHLGHT